MPLERPRTRQGFYPAELPKHQRHLPEAYQQVLQNLLLGAKSFAAARRSLQALGLVNWEDAVRTAKLDWKRLQPAGTHRDALKDDMKVIAQAVRADSEFVTTDDAESFFRYCEAVKGLYALDGSSYSSQKQGRVSSSIRS